MFTPTCTEGTAEPYACCRVIVTGHGVHYHFGCEAGRDAAVGAGADVGAVCDC